MKSTIILSGFALKGLIIGGADLSFSFSSFSLGFSFRVPEVFVSSSRLAAFPCIIVLLFGCGLVW